MNQQEMSKTFSRWLIYCRTCNACFASQTLEKTFKYLRISWYFIAHLSMIANIWASCVRWSKFERVQRESSELFSMSFANVSQVDLTAALEHEKYLSTHTLCVMMCPRLRQKRILFHLNLIYDCHLFDELYESIKKSFRSRLSRIIIFAALTAALEHWKNVDWIFGCQKHLEVRRTFRILSTGKFHSLLCFCCWCLRRIATRPPTMIISKLLCDRKSYLENKLCILLHDPSMQ